MSSATIVASTTQPGRWVWWCDICDHIGREQGGGGVENRLLLARARVQSHFMSTHVTMPNPETFPSPTSNQEES